MITPKFFALSLLLVSSCALARVHLKTHVEISDSSQQKRTISSAVQLDANETAMVQKDDSVRLETRLLSENENEVCVRCTISAKNAAGEYEVIANPELLTSYGKDAEIAIGNTEGDSLFVTLIAEKV